VLTGVRWRLLIIFLFNVLLSSFLHGHHVLSLKWILCVSSFCFTSLCAIMTTLPTYELYAYLLTREDDGEEEKMMNCLSIQREEKLWTYI